MSKARTQEKTEDGAASLQKVRRTSPQERRDAWTPLLAKKKRISRGRGPVPTVVQETCHAGTVRRVDAQGTLSLGPGGGEQVREKIQWNTRGLKGVRKSRGYFNITGKRIQFFHLHEIGPGRSPGKQGGESMGKNGPVNLQGNRPRGRPGRVGPGSTHEKIKGGEASGYRFQNGFGGEETKLLKGGEGKRQGGKGSIRKKRKKKSKSTNQNN